MAFSSWPFSGQPLDENKFELMQGRLSEDAWWSSPGGPDGQGYADTSGTTSKRRPGAVTIRGMYGEDLSERAFDHPANPGSNARIDRVVARRDMAANKIDDLLIVGTPSLNPTAPALTRTVGGVWDVPNYQVRIPANFRVAGTGNAQAVTQAMVSDERRFQGLRLIPVSSLDQVDSSGARLWQEWVLPDGSKYRWDGAALRAVGRQLQGKNWYPGGMNLGGDGYGAPDGLSAYSVSNGWCTASGRLGVGTAATYSHPIVFPLPVPPAVGSAGIGGTDGVDLSVSGTDIGTYRFRPVAPTVPGDSVYGPITAGLLNGIFVGWAFRPTSTDALVNRPAVGDRYSFTLSYPVA